MSVATDIGAQVDRGAYRDAEARLRSLLQNGAAAERGVLELRATLALVLLRLGRLEEALTEADSVSSRASSGGRGEREIAFRAAAIAADALVRLDRHQEAEKRALEALGECERELGGDNLAAAHLRQVVGEIAAERGELDRALREHSASLDVRERKLTAPHLDIASSLSDLASVCRKRGDLPKARLLLERAQKMKEEILGAEHPELAKTLNSLALLTVEAGEDRAHAERLFTRAVAYAERAGAVAESELAVYLLNLGSFLRTEGRVLEAHGTLERAVAVREHVHGAKHRSVAVARFQLGSVLHELGRYQDAVTELDAARKILEERPKTAENARVLLALGRADLSLDRYESAEHWFERAATIRRELSGHSNRETRLAESYVAVALAHRGDRKAAYRRARAAYEAEKKVRRERTAQGAQILANYGTTLLILGKRRKAANVLRAALTAHESALSPGHPETVDTSVRLAEALSELGGRSEEAEALVQFAIRIRTEACGRDHRELPAMYHLLGSLRNRQGCWDEAAEALGIALDGHARLGIMPDLTLFEELERASAASGALDALGDRYARLSQSSQPNKLLASTILLRQGLIRAAQGRWDTAIADLRVAAVQRERDLGAHDPFTVDARKLLGAAEAARGGGRPSGALDTALRTLSPSRPRRVLWNMSTLVVSLFFFVLSLGSGFSRQGLVLLIGTLLLHELGHLFAMWVFRYKNLSILFLPFLGAVAVGRRRQPSHFQRVMVYLAGPVPGVVLGLAAYVYYMRELEPFYARLASMLFLVNGFNLLPLMPLDGGRVVNDLLLERRPRAAGVFAIAGGIALSAWGVLGGSNILLIYGALCAVPVFAGYRERRLQGAILKSVGSSPSERDEHAAERAVLRSFRSRDLRDEDALLRYRLGHRTVKTLRVPAPSTVKLVSLFAIYLMWLGIAVAFAAALGRQTGYVENKVLQLVDAGNRDEAIRVAAENSNGTVGRSSTEVGLFELARIHREKGRLAEAESTLGELLQVFSREPDVQRLERAVVLIELSEVQRERGRDAEARASLEEAIPILKSLVGEAADETVDAEERLLDLLVRKEDFDAAEPLATELFAALEKDGFTVRQRNERLVELIARTFFAKSRYADAQPLLLQLEARRWEAYKGADNGILWTLRALADSYAATGRSTEAELAYKKLLALTTAIYGEENEREIEPLVASGTFYGRRGFYPPAERQLRRALMLAERHFGMDDQRLVPIMDELEFTLKGLRKASEANDLRARRDAIANPPRRKGPKERR